MQWCNRDPRCKKLQLTDLLVAPVQHSMKVPLMLRDIQNKTESQADRQLISTIIENEEASLRKLKDARRGEAPGLWVGVIWPTPNLLLSFQNYCTYILVC